MRPSSRCALSRLPRWLGFHDAFECLCVRVQHEILQDMPSGLRSEVAVYVCKPLIMKVPFFKDVSEGFVESLVTSLTPEVFLSGEVIVKEGTLAREMYFLNQVSRNSHGCLMPPPLMLLTYSSRW